LAMIPRGRAGVESGERQRRVLASGSSLRSKAVMDARAVNVAILVLLILELATPGPRRGRARDRPLLR
jgi:hypothetical protein